MDSLNLYSYLDNCSVKELQRTKQHIEQLIREKLPGERTLVPNLNANDFVDYQDNFISEAEHKAIMKALKSHKLFSSASANKGTISLWLSRTGKSYAWWSRKSGTVIHNEAVPVGNWGYP